MLLDLVLVLWVVIESLVLMVVVRLVGVEPGVTPRVRPLFMLIEGGSVVSVVGLVAEVIVIWLSPGAWLLPIWLSIY